MQRHHYLSFLVALLLSPVSGLAQEVCVDAPLPNLPKDSRQAILYKLVYEQTGVDADPAKGLWRDDGTRLCLVDGPANLASVVSEPSVMARWQQAQNDSASELLRQRQLLDELRQLEVRLEVDAVDLEDPTVSATTLRDAMRRVLRRDSIRRALGGE